MTQRPAAAHHPRWLRAALLGPAAVVTLLVASYAVDVPYWDTWDWLDRIYPDVSVGQGPTATDGGGTEPSVEQGPTATDGGGTEPSVEQGPTATDGGGTEPSGGQGPTATDAVRRYWPLFNGHRVFVPLLIDEALFSLSSIDVLPRVYVKLPLSLATLWLLIRLLRRTSPAARGPSHTVAALAIAGLAFPLAYWPMWMDARQFSMHIVVLAFVAAVLVASGPWRAGTRAVTSAGLCLVGSLSYGPGVFTWPFVFVLLWTRTPRPPAAVLATWAGIAGLVIGLHVIELRAQAPYDATAPPGAVAIVHATAAVAGLPVAPAAMSLGYKPTRVMGAAGLTLFACLAAVCWRSGQRMHAAPWIVVGGWAAAYVLGVAAARGGLALPALHEPRFAYGSAQLWIAVAALLHITTSAGERGATTRRWRAAAMTAACLIGAGYASATVWPFLAPGGIAALHVQLDTGRRCLLEYRTATDRCLELLYPSAERLRVLAARMDQRGAAFLSRAREQHDAGAQHRPAVEQ